MSPARSARRSIDHIPFSGYAPHVTSFKEKIGKRIANLRNAAGLTKTDAARKAGMPYKHWWRYETGEMETGIEKLAQIAKALGVSMDSLVEGL